MLISIRKFCERLYSQEVNLLYIGNMLSCRDSLVLSPRLLHIPCLSTCKTSRPSRETLASSPVYGPTSDALVRLTGHTPDPIILLAHNPTPSSSSYPDTQPGHASYPSQRTRPRTSHIAPCLKGPRSDRCYLTFSRFWVLCVGFPRIFGGRFRDRFPMLLCSDFRPSRPVKVVWTVTTSTSKWT